MKTRFHLTMNHCRSMVFAIIPLLLSSCLTLKPVEVTKIENFRTDLNTENPVVLFDVRVKNPNKFRSYFIKYGYGAGVVGKNNGRDCRIG